MAIRELSAYHSCQRATGLRPACWLPPARDRPTARSVDPMESVQIPCPKCCAELRLNNRNLLGRRGRCPNCGYRFILREPDDVELELAEPHSPVPAVGLAAQWVPDEALTAVSSPVGYQPAQRRGTASGPLPAMPQPPAYRGVESYSPVPEPPVPQETAPPAAAEYPAAAGPMVTAFGDEDPVRRVVRGRRNARGRKTRRRNAQIVAASLLAVMIAAAVVVVKLWPSAAENAGQNPPPAGPVAPAPGEPIPGEPVAAVPIAAEPVGAEPRAATIPETASEPRLQGAARTSEPASGGGAVDAASPTAGEPIDLRFLPAGARLIVNLRPAELWSDESRQQELRSCLGPLAEWLSARLQAVCLFEPQEIEEVRIVFLLGPTGSQPELAASVWLASAPPRSQLILKFGGMRMDDQAAPYYLAGSRAYLIDEGDPRHFAVGPGHLVGEMIDSQKFSAPTSSGIEQVLLKTDRARHVTVVFEPNDLRMHQEALAAPQVDALWNQLVDFFGDDVETAAWSLHLGSDALYSELLLRNHPVTRPELLQREMQTRVRELPKRVLAAVELMSPAQAGPRQVIGRFPAMMQAVALATRIEEGDRLVQLTTVLPGDRPAPNLALGALLTWDESTRTDFAAARPAATTARMLPEKIADRLKLPIEVDFRRMPLQDAFKFIGDEIQVRFEIDGDALKFAGYTKNMPQTFNLGTVPATQALQTILKQYDKMCLVVDENAKVVTVMTLDFAEQQGLTPFPLAP